MSSVRIVPARSDEPLADAQTAVAPEPARPDAAQSAASSPLQSANAALVAQQNSLQLCERRFFDAVRNYRKVTELVGSAPDQAAKHCHTMVNGFVREILSDADIAIRLLSETAGDKTAMHQVNVMVMCLLLGKSLGLDAQALSDLGMAAFVHDIGKLDLPERLRWNEDQLSTIEYGAYQEHVAHSVRMGRAMGLGAATLQAIAQHHELADGSGFPLRVQGDSMGTGSRILALVNRYDNLCNPAKASATMTPHEALALIYAQQKGRFDSLTLGAFIRMMGVYPPGSVVQLVDERFAMVVSVNSARPLKPKVVIFDPAAGDGTQALVTDLERAPQVGIRRSLKPSSLPAPAMRYLAPRSRISYFFEPVGTPRLAAEHA